MTIFGAVFSVANPLLEVAKSPANKILVIYFSSSGNTRSIDMEIQQFTYVEMCEILPTIPYTENHHILVEVAEMQAAENYRPLHPYPKTSPESFGTVFLGFPIWANTMPIIIYSFLDRYKFAGNRPLPFAPIYEDEEKSKQYGGYRKLDRVEVIEIFEKGMQAIF